MPKLQRAPNLTRRDLERVVRELPMSGAGQEENCLVLLEEMELGSRKGQAPFRVGERRKGRDGLDVWRLHLKLTGPGRTVKAPAVGIAYYGSLEQYRWALENGKGLERKCETPGCLRKEHWKEVPFWEAFPVAKRGKSGSGFGKWILPEDRPRVFREALARGGEGLLIKMPGGVIDDVRRLLRAWIHNWVKKNPGDRDFLTLRMLRRPEGMLLIEASWVENQPPLPPRILTPQEREKRMARLSAAGLQDKAQAPDHFPNTPTWEELQRMIESGEAKVWTPPENSGVPQELLPDSSPDPDQSEWTFLPKEPGTEKG